MRITVYIFFVALMGQSCSVSDDTSVFCTLETVAQQDPIIDDYIAENNMPMQVTASGLRYSIDEPGSGDNVGNKGIWAQVIFKKQRKEKFRCPAAARGR